MSDEERGKKRKRYPCLEAVCKWLAKVPKILFPVGWGFTYFLAAITILLASAGMRAVIAPQPTALNAVLPEYLLLVSLVGMLAFSAFAPSSPRTWVGSLERERHNDISNISRFAFVFSALGFYLMIRLGWNPAGDNRQLLYVVLLWGLACMTGGGFLGFLFGIPRSSGSGDADARPAKGVTSGAVVNTNLERISDWLTSIIVGGTVTQLANIPDWMLRFGRLYHKLLSPTGASPMGGDWVLAGIASTVLFIVIGFLSAYLITKLYLVGALKRADDPTVQQITRISTLSTVEMEALEAAPLHYGDIGDEFDLQAREAAGKIRGLDLSVLTNWRDVRVWAKAQLALAGDLETQPEGGGASVAVRNALEGYVKAIELAPDDAETRLGYAIALHLARSRRGHILTQLERARATIMPITSPDLRKNIYKSLVYALLYLKKPESFEKALCAVREYYGTTDVGESSGLLFNVACAYGQAYQWLKENPKLAFRGEILLYTTTQLPPTSGTPGDQQEWLMAGAFEVLSRAIRRTPAFRGKLAAMLDPSSTPGGETDDDLVCFADQRKFRELAGL